MRSEAGCLVILIELSIPLDSPFACRTFNRRSTTAEPSIRFSTISVERCVQKVPLLMWWTAGFMGVGTARG